MFLARSSAFLISVFVGTFSSQVFAKHYNSIKLSCEISGSEVSLTPADHIGPRIKKVSYPSTIKYVLNDIVYVSDGLAPLVSPISYTHSLNDSEFSIYLEESLSAPTVFEQFQSPHIGIALSHAQTFVRFQFSRDQLIEMLMALGSPTAETFHSESSSGFGSLEFLRTRYFLKPELFKAVKPAFGKQVGVHSSRDLPLEFTGWFGRSNLETCYQVEPINFEAPSDPYYNGLAYHLCGLCKVEPLESSSPVFAPVQNTLE